MNRSNFLLFLLLAACPGTQPVSYATDIAPVFDAKCTSCHGAGNFVLLDLSVPFSADAGLFEPNPWDEARSTALVEPGHPERSFLVDKIEGSNLIPETEGDPMPWQVPALSSEEISILRTWVTNGALNDTFYTDSVAPIFGDGLHLGKRGGKCSYCHYAQARFAPDVTQPFGARGLVGVTSSAFSALRVDPGNPDASVLIKKVEADPSVGNPMPYQPPRMTNDEIALVKRWILEGAKNN